MEEDTTQRRYQQKQDDFGPSAPGGFRTLGGEADTLRRLYHYEIDRSISKLEAQLEQVNAVGPVSSLVKHTQDNLCVLRACYVRQELPNQALDVLLQHLLELTRVLQRNKT